MKRNFPKKESHLFWCAHVKWNFPKEEHHLNQCTCETKHPKKGLPPNALRGLCFCTTTTTTSFCTELRYSPDGFFLLCYPTHEETLRPAFPDNSRVRVCQARVWRVGLTICHVPFHPPCFHQRLLIDLYFSFNLHHWRLTPKCRLSFEWKHKCGATKNDATKSHCQRGPDCSWKSN